MLLSDTMWLIKYDIIFFLLLSMGQQQKTIRIISPLYK
jgi:hypothetical protein